MLPAANRAKEKAKRTKCQHQLHQFYTIAVEYAEDHGGYLCSYEDMLKQMPMLCPSDKNNGKRQMVFTYNVPTSFWASTEVFLEVTNRGVHRDTWSKAKPGVRMPYAMLCEYEPYHDLSRKPAFERGKSEGRFLQLLLDGSTRWQLFTQ